MSEVTTYLINGLVAKGDAYIRAIEALPKDDLDYVEVAQPEKGSLKLCTHPDGFLVHHNLPDGSIWLVRPSVSRSDAKDLVAGFLAGRDDWRAGLDWEQIAFSSREGRYRTARILVITGIVVLLAVLVVRIIRH